MTTKECDLSLNDKIASFADNSSNAQNNSLNLNHNNKLLSEGVQISKSFTSDRRKEDSYDFTTDSQKNKEDYFRDKFMKSNCLEQVYPGQKKSCRKESGYKEKNSSKSNNSTLSLHIAAYEKSVEGTSDSNNSNENVVMKKNKEQKELIKKWKNTKHLSKDSASNIKNFYEIPRQQKENRASDPEVMQFKASQQLSNVNDPKTILPDAISKKIRELNIRDRYKIQPIIKEDQTMYGLLKYNTPDKDTLEILISNMKLEILHVSLYPDKREKPRKDIKLFQCGFYLGNRECCGGYVIILSKDKTFESFGRHHQSCPLQRFETKDEENAMDEELETTLIPSTPSTTTSQITDVDSTPRDKILQDSGQFDAPLPKTASSQEGSTADYELAKYNQEIQSMLAKFNVNNMDKYQINRYKKQIILIQENLKTYTNCQDYANVDYYLQNLNGRIEEAMKEHNSMIITIETSTSKLENLKRKMEEKYKANYKEILDNYSNSVDKLESNGKNLFIPLDQAEIIKLNNLKFKLRQCFEIVASEDTSHQQQKPSQESSNVIRNDSIGSPNDLNSSDRDIFAKTQLTAVQKILNDQNAPLKQEDARVLIVGTHKERSAQVFWNTVSNAMLEKHPIVTWKFCHILHKLIRDGHRNVTSDSYKFKNRLVQLGNFWQHLRGYGEANFSYCNALVTRLEFHHQHAWIPGNFKLAPKDINLFSENRDESYKLAVDLMVILKSLLNVQQKIQSIMKEQRLSSSSLPGQCTLSPTIEFIVDSKDIYEMARILLCNLNVQLSDDHKEKLDAIYKQLKSVYSAARKCDFIKFEIVVPSLSPPNLKFGKSAPNPTRNEDSLSGEYPIALEVGDDDYSTERNEQSLSYHSAVSQILDYPCESSNDHTISCLTSALDSALKSKLEEEEKIEEPKKQTDYLVERLQKLRQNEPDNEGLTSAFCALQPNLEEPNVEEKNDNDLERQLIELRVPDETLREEEEHDSSDPFENSTERDTAATLNQIAAIKNLTVQQKKLDQLKKKRKEKEQNLEKDKDKSSKK